MTPEPSYVVDTSVLVRWYLAQVGWEHARKVRDLYIGGEIELVTVECARYEMPWVLRKKGLLAGALTLPEYLAASRTIDDFGIAVFVPDADAIEECAALSVTHGITFFDAMFVLHSLRSGSVLLTADQRLARSAGSLVATAVLEGI
ncbi:MAG: type II toxin-antitoxin system VapC family toxin [Pseudonocardia sp.]|nr:type II toxin-antitoxin system VapC family toxin [Pseudonocardia sp.]